MIVKELNYLLGKLYEPLETLMHNFLYIILFSLNHNEVRFFKNHIVIILTKESNGNP